ncbi:MAG TPA: glycoside hydrolase family 3 N-terminal domain-containing protein [Terriglobales bacterium]|nr:glycoside hydrolase family 3 N-terminal domain-containing protein [Terriglobales bacterium]
MSKDLSRDAHAVLFPAFDALDLDTTLVSFLYAGGKALLVGESRAEYVARRMDDARQHAEKAEQFRALAVKARGLAGKVLIGVDQELAGIQRLHRLVPPLPELNVAHRLSSAEIEAAARATADGAVGLGINLFLAPILDVLRGENPWLQGRTLGPDMDEVARISAAFIRGVQSAGVAATAKHFPGHPVTPEDPALAEAVVPGPAQEIVELASPFRVAINAGVKIVMTGPALVPSLDPHLAASVSPNIVRMLRADFGFDGLIMSDDLDAPGIMRGASLIDTAIASLAAGVDLLLLAAGPHLPDVTRGILAAVEDGRLPAVRLREAADRVRALAESVG